MASPENKDTEVKTSPNNPDRKTTFNTVFIKLPEFYTSNPASWFLQREAQFGIRSVTQDETKFWHVLATLDVETSAHVSGLISLAATSQKYSTLKEFLIKTYSPTRWGHAERIISMTNWATENHLPWPTNSLPGSVSSTVTFYSNKSSSVRYQRMSKMPSLVAT